MFLSLFSISLSFLYHFRLSPFPLSCTLFLPIQSSLVSPFLFLSLSRLISPFLADDLLLSLIAPFLSTINTLSPSLSLSLFFCLASIYLVFPYLCFFYLTFLFLLYSPTLFLPPLSFSLLFSPLSISLFLFHFPFPNPVPRWGNVLPSYNLSDGQRIYPNNSTGSDYLAFLHWQSCVKSFPAFWHLNCSDTDPL